MNQVCDYMEAFDWPAGDELSLFAGIPLDIVDGCNILYYLGVKFHLQNYFLVLVSFFIL